MYFKKILPYENYVLRTNLSADEVYKRLAQNIEPRKTFRFSFFNRSETAKPYQGDINPTAFNISRVINYRNSFLPDINGMVSVVAGQTLVKIVMKPAILVIAFMGVWMGVVGLVCIATLAAGIFDMAKKSDHGNSSPMILIPFAMFLFGWALIYFGFKTESRRSKDFLATLLNGHEL